MSRSSSAGDVTIRVTNQMEASEPNRQPFYGNALRNSQPKRVPSPLHTTYINQAEGEYERDLIRSAGLPPLPLSPAPLRMPSPPAARTYSTADSLPVSDSVPVSAERNLQSKNDSDIKPNESANLKARPGDSLRLQTRLQDVGAEIRQNSQTRPPLLTSLSATDSPRMEKASSPRIATTNPISMSSIKREGGGSRTASMDSTTSLSQSPSQSLHIHLVGDSPDVVDIPALIAGAGSAEAAIKKLLVDKYAAAQNNAQLWRLLDKQRAMMVDLNKDLQRSIRDRDKYKKRLKDHLLSSASSSTISRSMVNSDFTLDNLGQDLSASQSTITGHDVYNEPNGSASVNSNVRMPSSNNGLLLSSSSTASINPMYAKPMQAPFAMGENQRSVSSPRRLETTNTIFPEHRIPSGPPSAMIQDNTIDDHIRKLEEATRLQKSLSNDDSRNETTPVSETRTPSSFSTTIKDRSSQRTRKEAPPALDLSPDYARTDTHSDADRGEDEKSLKFDNVKSDLSIDHSNSRTKDPSISTPAIPLSARSAESASVIASSICDSPEDLGSPQVASVQTYQSLNIINAVLKTLENPEGSDNQRSHMEHSLSSPGLYQTTEPLLQAKISQPIRSTLNAMATASGDVVNDVHSQNRRPAGLMREASNGSTNHLSRSNTYTESLRRVASSNGTIPNNDTSGSLNTVQDSVMSPSVEQPRGPGEIHRGFVDERWPGLLITPQTLSEAYIKVDSSRLRPSRNIAPKQAEENPVFSLAIHSKLDNTQLWRIEKTLVAMAALDVQLKNSSTFKTKLPDRTLFTGHAPARIDARRMALLIYFESMLASNLNEKAAVVVCNFFSTDAIGPEQQDYFQSTHTPGSTTSLTGTARIRSRKDGYLTKKGKNFGGWKARYFVLAGPMLKYFEAPGGAQLGAIRLQDASIGRQTTQQQDDVDEENQFRHAFLILEPKRKDKQNHVKHVLCAESDEERDAWVSCLMQYVDAEDDLPRPQTSKTPEKGTNITPRSPRNFKSMSDMRNQASAGMNHPDLPVNLRSMKYDTISPTEASIAGLPQSEKPMSPTVRMNGGAEEDEDRNMNAYPIISGPTNATVIQDAGIWGNRKEPNILTKENRAKEFAGERERKRSIFQFKAKPSAENNSNNDGVGPSQSASHFPTQRVVFGASLADAVEFAAPNNADVQLPAVVYRSIQYLRAREAKFEEGIFRMSGSNLVVKALRERFDNEGDVDLCAPNEQSYDIHAVASLLKLYLRELPASILTREAHMTFLKCLELDEEIKIEGFNILINRLPILNRELLSTLNEFLREIVDNEGVNKMGVRNVAIVFAPTLNIPAPLISLFITDYERLFGPSIDIEPIKDRLPAFIIEQSTNNSGDSQDKDDFMNGSRYNLFGEFATSNSISNIPSSRSDLSMTQRLAKEAYDIGPSTTPTPRKAPTRAPPPAALLTDDQTEQLKPQVDSVRKASDDTSSNYSQNEESPVINDEQSITFRTINFPDPPGSARIAPTEYRQQSTSTNALHSPRSNLTKSSQSSVFTLTSPTAANFQRSVPIPAAKNTLKKKSPITTANLNDITISSSPLMGGTSPDLDKGNVSTFSAQQVYHQKPASTRSNTSTPTNSSAPNSALTINSSVMSTSDLTGVSASAPSSAGGWSMNGSGLGASHSGPVGGVYAAGNALKGMFGGSREKGNSHSNVSNGNVNGSGRSLLRRQSGNFLGRFNSGDDRE